MHIKPPNRPSRLSQVFSPEDEANILDQLSFSDRSQSREGIPQPGEPGIEIHEPPAHPGSQSASQSASQLPRETLETNGHTFRLHTFKTPAACGSCHGSIWQYGSERRPCRETQMQICYQWALQKIGYKCKNCTADVHISCAQDYDSPCESGLFIRAVRKNLGAARRRNRSIEDYAQIVRPSAGYNLEDGLSGILRGTHELTTPAALGEAAWFRLYFVDHEYDHFVMVDKKNRFEPFIISILREEPSEEGEGADFDLVAESGEETGEEEEDSRSILTTNSNYSNTVASARPLEGDRPEESEEKERKKKEKEQKKQKRKEKKEQKKEKRKDKRLIQKLKKPQDDTLYRVIVWKKSGKEQFTIPVRHNELLSGAQIAEIVLTEEEKGGSLKVMEKGQHFENLSKELIIMEREEHTNNFKIGVIYTKKGQNHEDDFFGNQEGSEEFYQFLDILADKIPLKGFEGFRGGLDVEGDASGEHSYYTEHQGNNIMFHISTLLPFTPNDPQQVKRKRHIGNDIVCVIFQDSPGCCFSPRAIKSQLIHCFIAVCQETLPSGGKRYRVNVTTKDSVPPFGPPVPDPPLFLNPKELRDFLLQKIVNAERSALFSEAFQTRRERTLAAHLSYISSRYSSEATGKKNMIKHKIGERKAPKGLSLDLNFSKNLQSLPSPFSGSRSARSLQPSQPAQPIPEQTMQRVKTNEFHHSQTLRKNQFRKASDSTSSPQSPPRLKRRGSAPTLSAVLGDEGNENEEEGHELRQPKILITKDF